MKSLMKIVAVAAAITGATGLGALPAKADSLGISIGNGGVGFSLSTGGYCDSWGCPDDYWNYPVFYGPVYYGGTWYRGPVYYRTIGGVHYYWVHGGWHRNYYRGHRRHGWHYGPALGRDYYRHHGFRVREYRQHQRWHRRHNRHEVRHERREHHRNVRYQRHHGGGHHTSAHHTSAHHNSHHSGNHHDSGHHDRNRHDHDHDHDRHH